MNAAMLYAVFEREDLSSGTWTCRASNAGLIAPLFLHGKQSEYVDVSGLPLGAIPEAAYDERTLALAPGDVVILASDGALEAKNQNGELLSFERFEQMVKRAGHAKRSAREIADQIKAAVEAFAGQTARTDDITMVVVRVS